MAAPRVDLVALAAQADVDLPKAFAALGKFYDEVDARNARNSQGLDLPCHRGCSMCCHESVFLTALEFFYAWDYVQTHLDDQARAAIVAQGLALYRQFAAQIGRLNEPPEDGHKDHFAVAKQIRFACPMLSEAGACRIYPARELLARLFGCSFNDAGGIYGCHLVADHLQDKVVTLAKARPVAQLLGEMPLTEKRQVYPYWIWLLYGEDGASAPAAPAAT